MISTIFINAGNTAACRHVAGKHAFPQVSMKKKNSHI